MLHVFKFKRFKFSTIEISSIPFTCQCIYRYTLNDIHVELYKNDKQVKMKRLTIQTILRLRSHHKLQCKWLFVKIVGVLLYLFCIFFTINKIYLPIWSNDNLLCDKYWHFRTVISVKSFYCLCILHLLFFHLCFSFFFFFVHRFTYFFL